MTQQLTSRPIRFTADLPAWRHLVETLGGRLLLERPGWLVTGRAVGAATVPRGRRGRRGVGGVRSAVTSRGAPWQVGRVGQVGEGLADAVGEGGETAGVAEE